MKFILAIEVDSIEVVPQANEIGVICGNIANMLGEAFSGKPVSMEVAITDMISGTVPAPASDD